MAYGLWHGCGHGDGGGLEHLHEIELLHGAHRGWKSSAAGGGREWSRVSGLIQTDPFELYPQSEAGMEKGGVNDNR